MILLKSEHSDMLPVLLILLLICLLVLSMIFKIFEGLKKRRAAKADALLKEKEVNWANEAGIQFYGLLIQKLRNNESAAITTFNELAGLENYTKESINTRFDVQNGPFDLRIPAALEFLNSRYLAETDELIGVSEEQAQAEHGINLNNDELLYEMYQDCTWFELKRNQARSWNYHGLGLRIPLGGGLSYRLGSIQNLNPQARFEYRQISKGKVYLTNKRIIFQGDSENKVVTLKSLLDIEQYNDSCVIGKSTGKKPIIQFELDDAAIFARKLSRLFDTV